MKTKGVSRILTVVGTLMMLVAIVGRFVYARTVLGGLIPGGISAQSAMVGANTVLLLAILAYLYSPKE
jgi:hypothetical protein